MGEDRKTQANPSESFDLVACLPLSVCVCESECSFSYSLYIYYIIIYHSLYTLFIEHIKTYDRLEIIKNTFYLFEVFFMKSLNLVRVFQCVIVF